MSRINKILGGLLLVQAALGLLTWTSMASKTEKSAIKPAFDLDRKKVEEVQVWDKSTAQSEQTANVHLARRDGEWVFADRDDFPADREKVEKLIDQLMDLKLGAVLVTTAANHNALKVGQSAHDRKVTVKSGQGARTVFLGSGASNSLNLRFDGKNEVYRARGTSVWSIGTITRTYLNPRYVRLDKDKLSSALVNTEKGRLSFTRENDSWTLAELPAGETLDDGKVKSFISKLSGFDLEEPIGKQIKPEHGLDSGAEVVLAGSEDGNPIGKRYLVGGRRDDKTFYAKADDSDWVVAVSKWNAEDILNKTAADFEKKTEKPQ